MAGKVTWNVQEMAAKFREAHPLELMKFAVEELGAASLTLACSFGYEDVALVDLASRLETPIDIFYLDTDLLFEQTYEVRDRLQEKYQLEFIRVSPAISLAEQAEKFGEELWKTQPSKCCQLRKVGPLRQVLAGYQGWITGIRREQSPTRAHTEVLEWDEAFELWKFNPLAYWTESAVWDYIYKHQVPYNPMHDQNYPSIGCYPCTRPVAAGEDPRAGRWAGFAKTECGLHDQTDNN